MPSRRETRSSARSKAEYQLLVPILRRARGQLSQAEVAERIGKPQSWVAKVEAGERRIDPAELLNFAEAVGADAIALYRALLREIRRLRTRR